MGRSLQQEAAPASEFLPTIVLQNALQLGDSRDCLANVVPMHAIIAFYYDNFQIVILPDEADGNNIILRVG